ncbi:sialidase family protein [Mucilaginibacter ginkgonis]|uniref:exo-alpha-sialidase n=1 Tax=Mucilaginibacter ginkgonis TaxID=2682091 RepID=A0A7T7JHH8_9SPHI|nr:sialidase family protein [Mucilaginibacter ginkgonis]QQL50304.1 exo-alpha-sialidase [Mucilaginibacter ginkgonis]
MRNTGCLKALCGVTAIICIVAGLSFTVHAKTGIKGDKPQRSSRIKDKADVAFSDTALLFEPVRDGYTMYHVPSMTITAKGTILAFAEGRFGQGKDWDDIDLVMRRSTDGGKTWQPRVVIIPHSTGKPTSNITPIADKDGTVHLLFQINYQNAFYLQSKDEGKTWTKPVDITYVYNEFKSQYPWQVLAPGPGHAIQLANGRLLVPTWLCVPNKKIPGGDHRPSCVATIYSDDHGKTWHRGDIIVNNGDLSADGKDTIVNPNESVVVQLSDGRVMMNTRNENMVNRRLIFYSNDGATGWSKPVFDQDLYDPVCMASMVKISSDKSAVKPIIFVNADSRNDARSTKKGRPVFKPRENITARASFDNGKTWPVFKPLFTGGSGYSDLATDKSGLIYCIYEKRDGDPNVWRYRIVMQRFNLAWLKEKQQ